jgi:hypothetical protein
MSSIAEDKHHASVHSRAPQLLSALQLAGSQCSSLTLRSRCSNALTWSYGCISTKAVAWHRPDGGAPPGPGSAAAAACWGICCSYCSQVCSAGSDTGHSLSNDYLSSIRGVDAVEDREDATAADAGAVAGAPVVGIAWTDGPTSWTWAGSS